MGPNSASLRLGNTSPFKEVLQQLQAVGNTVSDLTGPRFEPQTFRSREERDTDRPPGRCPTRIELGIIFYKIKAHLLFNIQAHLQDKYRWKIPLYSHHFNQKVHQDANNFQIKERCSKFGSDFFEIFLWHFSLFYVCSYTVCWTYSRLLTAITWGDCVLQERDTQFQYIALELCSNTLQEVSMPVI